MEAVSLKNVSSLIKFLKQVNPWSGFALLRFIVWGTPEIASTGLAALTPVSRFVSLGGAGLIVWAIAEVVLGVAQFGNLDALTFGASCLWRLNWGTIALPLGELIFGLASGAVFAYCGAVLAQRTRNVGDPGRWLWIGYFLSSFVWIIIGQVLQIGLKSLGFKLELHLVGRLWYRFSDVVLLIASLFLPALFYVRQCWQRLVGIVGDRINDDRSTRILIKPVCLVVFIASYLSIYVSTLDLNRTSPSPTHTWFNPSLPVKGTLIACEPHAKQLLCALTLWPGYAHDFTVYGAWTARVDTKHPSFVVGAPALAQSVWHVVQDTDQSLGVVSLAPLAPIDVQIVSDRVEACAFAQISAADQDGTTVAFEVMNRPGNRGGSNI